MSRFARDAVGVWGDFGRNPRSLNTLLLLVVVVVEEVAMMIFFFLSFSSDLPVGERSDLPPPRARATPPA